MQQYLKEMVGKQRSSDIQAVLKGVFKVGQAISKGNTNTNDQEQDRQIDQVDNI